MGIPLWVTNCFSLAAFKILSSALTFGNLIMMCLGVALLKENMLAEITFVNQTISYQVMC